jgi:hypothetical protein
MDVNVRAVALQLWILSCIKVQTVKKKNNVRINDATIIKSGVGCN